MRLIILLPELPVKPTLAVDEDGYPAPTEAERAAHDNYLAMLTEFQAFEQAARAHYSGKFKRLFDPAVGTTVSKDGAGYRLITLDLPRTCTTDQFLQCIPATIEDVTTAVADPPIWLTANGYE